ncbi:hypothetical protein GPK27_06565 [Catenibacterium mitsuokai]|uniref:hypothetical protein n=1 Tax=Coprobacillaceae TaxID=2810280 RepID=UPI00192BA24B|nr:MULTISPECIES: hypothetical protein [Coprobacillaceae]MBT9815109.1 hypothetical protein [Catenibacterium mitsuokai]MCR1948702.1 YolD-like family protein [Thomasclavelia ramosa]QQY26176.1 hypothetical protein I6I63_08705 [Thomasclavelia ramosa]
MKKKNDIHNYEDIINVPRHISKVHPRMSNEDRAAQFAPFAALTGHKEAISETERITEKRKILDENQKEIIDRKLLFILENIKEHIFVKIIYFVEDNKKEGGSYVTIEGNVKKIDEFENTITLLENFKINITDIFNIDIL